MGLDEDGGWGSCRVNDITCAPFPFPFPITRAALRELQRVDPKEPVWYNILGKVLTTLKRHDEANEQFRKVTPARVCVCVCVCVCVHLTCACEGSVDSWCRVHVRFRDRARVRVDVHHFSACVRVRFFALRGSVWS